MPKLYERDYLSIRLKYNRFRDWEVTHLQSINRSLKFIVKLKQRSGKDRQGMIIKRLLKTPERP